MRKAEKRAFLEMHRVFQRLSAKSADWFGSPWAFVAAILMLVVWGITGPVFHFSDTWQLIANTATSVITFMMVFIIQSSQNRDTRALHLKLDELIRATAGTRNAMVNLEDLSDEQIVRLKAEFERVSRIGGTGPVHDVVEITVEDEMTGEQSNDDQVSSGDVV
jgi:low affinity Fe/Cu permease